MIIAIEVNIFLVVIIWKLKQNDGRNSKTWPPEKLVTICFNNSIIFISYIIGLNDSSIDINFPMHSKCSCLHIYTPNSFSAKIIILNIPIQFLDTSNFPLKLFYLLITAFDLYTLVFLCLWWFISFMTTMQTNWNFKRSK